LDHLVLFVKNPILGAVKTRLAESVGDEEALIVYMKLLKHTREVALKMDAQRYVYYNKHVVQTDQWLSTDFNKKAQKGPDLGTRMNEAFRAQFEEGADKIVLIGSDCFDLEPGHLKAAFKSLDKSDFVLGPAIDGGYYLIGMRQPAAFVFEGIRWSTNTVFDETRKAILSRGFSLDILDELSDIDNLEDLKRYPELY